MRATLFQFQLFHNLPVQHFITERYPGYSMPPYASLNLGYHTEDDPNLVTLNRKLLAKTTGISISRFYYGNQVHGCEVMKIDSPLGLGRKSAGDKPVGNCDALITNLTEKCLMVFTADCVPVLFYDPEHHVVGIAHAGWRGTMENITGETVGKMKNEYGTKADRLLVAIGPAIGPCCYEVGAEVIDRAKLVFSKPQSFLYEIDKKYHFDLWAANRFQLLQSGVRSENIEIAQLCTKCHSNRFFSSRASSGVTGRFAAGIMLLKK